MAHGRPRRKPMSEINVVPYIDVMLVLLVIFMITTPLLQTGVEVELPDADAKTVESEQDTTPIIVTIDAEGNIYLGDEEEITPSDNLASRVSGMLRVAKQQGKKPPVLVAGDAAVDYGQVVRVMAKLQAAGAPQVGLLTNPPEGQ